jgi:hypothetical protein
MEVMGGVNLSHCPVCAVFDPLSFIFHARFLCSRVSCFLRRGGESPGWCGFDGVDWRACSWLVF